MKKCLVLLILLIGCNCVKSEFPLDNGGIVIFGKYMHMNGLEDHKIQVVDYSYDHPEETRGVVEWINEKLGSEVLLYNDTGLMLPGSAILIGEIELGRGELGMMRGDPNQDGGMDLCLVAINLTLKEMDENREVILKHEILHCLGLSDDVTTIRTEEGKTSIMTGLYNGNDVDMTESDVNYLKSLYGLN